MVYLKHNKNVNECLIDVLIDNGSDINDVDG